MINENIENDNCNNEVGIDDLKAKGMNENIAKAIIEKDYETLVKAIDESITEEIEKRITSNVPKTKQVDDYSKHMKKFESMGYKERLELSRKNPRLYKALVEKSMQA